MSQTQDDQDAERAVRVSFRWMLLGYVLLVAGVTAYAVLPEDHIWVSSVLNLTAAFVMLASSSKIGEAESYPRYYRDFILKRFRMLLVALTLIALVGAKTLASISLPPAGQETRLFTALIMVGLAPLVFLIGPGREADEDLTRIQLGRAMTVGYGAMVLAVLAVIVATIVAPALAMAMISWGLFAGIAMPILTYVILDWRSNRGLDG